MRGVCPAAVVGLAMGLGLLVTRAVAGLGQMEVGFGFGLLPRATSGNLQTFTGALGGAVADAITSTGNSDRPFSVQGNTFTTFSDALQRSCDNQNNACADVANGSNAKGLTVSECAKQETSCLQATQGSGTDAESSTTTASAQQTLFSQDANFLYICDA